MTDSDKERIEKEADDYAEFRTSRDRSRKVKRNSYIAGATKERELMAEQLKQVHNKANFLVKALKEIQNIPETGAYEHKIIEEAFELSGITGLSESLKQ